MAERQGVEIDYCPACRGIWLDRGELDKLLERAAAHVGSPPAQPVDRETQRHPKYDDDRHHAYKHRHTKSWLSDIFD